MNGDLLVCRGPAGGWSWLDVPRAAWVVYGWFDVADELLYVGHSSRPRERLQEHAHRGHGWSLLACSVLVVPVSGEVEARWMEAELIERLRPRANPKLARGERTRLQKLLAA